MRHDSAATTAPPRQRRHDSAATTAPPRQRRRARAGSPRTRLLGGAGGLATGVHTAALLGRGDALALALEDQGAFEFGEGAHDRQQQVDDGTSIHAATKLEEIIGVPVADIVTRVESFTLNEATIVSPAGTVLIAEAARRANPAQIFDKVVEEEAEDRCKCKNGSSRVGLISREEEPTSPEWEYHMYRQFHSVMKWSSM